MKLTDLEIFVVKNKPPGWGGRYFIFVKLTRIMALWDMEKSMLPPLALMLCVL